ncbi:MAG TPA: PP2C family protein-serine/threonine phosphatase [Armatimonadota bacterium]
MQSRRSDPSRSASRFLEQQTDLFSALLRLAFLVAFLGSTVLSPVPMKQEWPVRVIVVLAGAFTSVVFLYYFRRKSLTWQRSISLPLDVALVSGALFAAGENYWGALFQVYYLIVIEGAIWFQVPGAVLTALGAIGGYALVLVATLPPGTPAMSFLATDTTGLPFLGIPFLITVAVVSGYLVQSRDEEQAQASRIRNEMLLARTLQDVMLPPQPPDIPGWRAALRLEPALEVGGDLYILERLESGDYLVCLGDISGKSVSGLIYLSLILSHTRSAAREGLAPREIAYEVNRQIYDSLAPETYAALFIGLLNPHTGALTFVNCGHPPPLLLSPHRGQLDTLTSGGIVVGATRSPRYDQKTVTVRPGEIVIAYTDGISESRNHQGEEFQETRIANAALKSLGEGARPQETANRVVEAARRWSARPRSDDATCLVLQRLESGKEDPDPPAAPAPS